MILDFSKIKWAGMDCILVTNRDECRKPLLILDKYDLEKMNKLFLESEESEQ